MKILTSSTICFFFIVAVAVVFTIAVTIRVDAAHRPVPQHHKTHHYGASPEVHDGMPDHTLPHNKRALECSSCKVLTEEVWERLHTLSKKMNGRPRHSQQVDLIEDMCERVKLEYGLLIRNNKPTLEFSRDDAISRVKGSWVNVYLEGRCGKILASHEEQILEKYKQVKDLPEFQSVICQKLDKSCLQEKFVKDKPNADL